MAVVLAGQGVHAVAPVALVNCPGLHGTHTSVGGVTVPVAPSTASARKTHTQDMGEHVVLPGRVFGTADYFSIHGDATSSTRTFLVRVLSDLLNK